MSNRIEELVAGELDRLPDHLKPFVDRWREDHDLITMAKDDMAYAYGRTFIELAQLTLDHGRAKSSLVVPMIFSARHSMELHLMWAIDEHRECLDDLGARIFAHEEIRHHNLGWLWNLLVRIVGYVGRHVGAPSQDLYVRYCEARLKWIDEIDPDGLEFLYPYKLQDQSFELTSIQLEDLIKAHWHVSTYAEASAEFHLDLTRPEVHRKFFRSE